MNASDLSRRLSFGSLKVGKPARSNYIFSGGWSIGRPHSWLLIDTSLGYFGGSTTVLASGFSPADIYMKLRDTVPSQNGQGISQMVLAISSMYMTPGRPVIDPSITLVIAVVNSSSHNEALDLFRDLSRNYATGKVYTYESLKAAMAYKTNRKNRQSHAPTDTR